MDAKGWDGEPLWVLLAVAAFLVIAYVVLL